MKIVEIVGIAIILLSLAISIYLYPQLPEKIATHWNASGEVDGYTDKLVGLFLMPAVIIILLALFLVIPKIDPLKRNIEKFRGYFDGFVVMIMVFMFYIYMLLISWNLGMRFNFMYAIVPAISILFYYCGILIEHAKRNWFIGIRTPWTLSSEDVWNKTHARGAKLFKACAVISIIGLLFSEYAIWFILVPVIAMVVYLFVYSYFEYKK
ncbi:MAG: DUF1648 domain-containing protein [Candidatus Aenigmatarchaeota archaeon]